MIYHQDVNVNFDTWIAWQRQMFGWLLKERQNVRVIYFFIVATILAFSMGDLGVQVSVRLSVRPSVKIYPGCLVSATPLTVLYRSFWNFTCVVFMEWGCACCLDIIVSLFLSLFPLCELIVQRVGTSWAQFLIPFYTSLFETLHMFSPWPEDVHMVWI